AAEEPWANQQPPQQTAPQAVTPVTAIDMTWVARKEPSEHESRLLIAPLACRRTPSPPTWIARLVTRLDGRRCVCSRWCYVLTPTLVSVCAATCAACAAGVAARRRAGR